MEVQLFTDVHISLAWLFFLGHQQCFKQFALSFVNLYHKKQNIITLNLSEK